MRHPERFDPGEGTGKLIDSEHRARYHWASRAVAGKDVLDAACGVGYGIEILAAAGAKSVTGVDLDPEAIAAAKSRFGKDAADLVEADLGELPFADDSFDAVVCFETIEHVEEPKRALAELRRVLRADGLLIVSSPNPDSYVGGNEHHVHEFRPEELVEAVGEHFANVAPYRQDAWLGSSIEAANGGIEIGKIGSRDLLRTGDSDDEPPYSAVVAGDGELEEIAALLACGDTFDVRWWSEQLSNLRGEVMEANEHAASLHRQLQETSTALLDANQELAQIPLLRHRMETLGEQHAELSAEYHALLASSSWKLTAPLRRAKSRG